MGDCGLSASWIFGLGSRATSSSLFGLVVCSLPKLFETGSVGKDFLEIFENVLHEHIVNTRVEEPDLLHKYEKRTQNILNNRK
jgi:hypothetical protein